MNSNFLQKKKLKLISVGTQTVKQQVVAEMNVQQEKTLEPEETELKLMKMLIDTVSEK